MSLVKNENPLPEESGLLTWIMLKRKKSRGLSLGACQDPGVDRKRRS